MKHLHRIALLIMMLSCQKDPLVTPDMPQSPQTDTTFVLRIDPEDISFTVGGHSRCRALLELYGDGSLLKTTNVTRYVEWSEEDEDIIGFRAKGIVEGYSEGTTTISATYHTDDRTLTADSQISVVAGVPLRLTLSIRSATLFTYESFGKHRTDANIRSAVCTFIDDTQKQILPYQMSWKSSDESVATVSDYGLVKAVGEGFADVIATYAHGGFEISDTCRICVFDNGPDKPVKHVTSVSPWSDGHRFGMKIDSFSDGTPGDRIGFTYDVVRSDGQPSMPVGKAGASGPKGCEYETGTNSVTIEMKSTDLYQVDERGNCGHLTAVITLSVK
jgi:hypothetical protein